MPASSPFDGRRWSRIFFPSCINSTVFSSIFLGFALLLCGSRLLLPCAHARQYGCQGHCVHLGSPFGTHTVAPSSIIACVNAPARVLGIVGASSRSTSFFTDCFIISESSSDTRISIRSTFPSTAGTGMPYAMEAIAPAV